MRVVGESAAQLGDRQPHPHRPAILTHPAGDPGRADRARKLAILSAVPTWGSGRAIAAARWGTFNSAPGSEPALPKGLLGRLPGARSTGIRPSCLPIPSMSSTLWSIAWAGAAAVNRSPSGAANLAIRNWALSAILDGFIIPPGRCPSARNRTLRQSFRQEGMTP